MSTNVESDAVSGILEKLAEYLEAAEKVVVQYAPDVWQATLMIVQVKSIVCLLAFAGILGVSVYTLRLALKRMADNVWVEWPIPVSLFSGAAIIASSLALLINGIGWILGALRPELAILYSLGAKAGLF